MLPERAYLGHCQRLSGLLLTRCCIEIDQTDGQLSSDFTAAQAFRKETIEYIGHCLQLAAPQPWTPMPKSKIIAFFKVIGDAACATFSIGN